MKEARYPSIESFLEIAVRNQLLLETEGKIESTKNKDLKEITDSDRPQLSIPEKTPQILGVSPLNEAARTMPIWGQVNRLAPTKFVLRLLLNYLADSDERSIDLKRFSAETAERATEFKLFVKKKDKTRRIRGTELYVAFPKKDPSSQQRFLNYYLGKSPFKKWTDSVLTGLSLAKIEETDEGAIFIGLTESGLKFGMLHSPLIDDFFSDGKEISSSFSEEETDFLIEHIKSTRPGEYDFLMFTLASVKKGADTPTKLKDRIYEFLKNRDLGFQFSQKVANTMQIGATGRLVELGLLKIEKSAQKSKYLVQEKGEKLSAGF